MAKGTGKVEVVGLAAFRREIRKATDDGAGEELLKEANYRAGLEVIRWAKAEAQGDKQRESAAKTLTSLRRGYGVYVVGGDKTVPYFGGANFGADRDVRRIIKNKRQGKRSRATRVRDDEDIEKVVRKIEQQYVDKRGRTVTQKEGGRQIKVSRTKSGGARTIKGWNQFGKWTKNKDYFLYRGVNRNYKDLQMIYESMMRRALKDAFPD
jgi:hypothetical protein